MTKNQASSQVSRRRRTVLAILVCLLPFVALGPYSFVRVHDNGDSTLPSMMIVANAIHLWENSGFWSWFPFQGTGVPSFSQGMINLYQIPFFAFLPDWLAYQGLILSHVLLAGLCLHRLLRDAFSLSDYTAGWFAAGYAVLGYKLGMLDNLPNAWTFPIVYAMWRFSQSYGFYLQIALSLGIGLAFGLLASSFFLISFHFITVCVLLVVLASSARRGFILAAFFFVGLLAGNAPEIFSLLSLSSISHRVMHSPNYWDVVGNLLFYNAISVQVALGILAVINLNFWSGHVRSLVIWWTILIAVFLVTPIVNPILPTMIKGLNLARFIEPIRDLSFILAPLVIIKIQQGAGFAWLMKQSWSRLGLQFTPILILTFGIVSYYLNHGRSFIETGGFTRYHFEVFQRLVEKNDKRLGVFRVESLHYPGGSAFLSAYGLESIGGYLNLYSKRYQEFFFRVISPKDQNVPMSPFVSKYMKSGTNHLDVNCYHKIGHALDISKCANLDLFALANVRYIFSRHTLMHPDLQLIEGPQQAWASFDTATKIWRAIQEIFGASPHIQLYKLNTALPRAFVPNSVEIFADNSGVLNALKKRNVRSLGQTAIMSNSDLQNQSRSITAEMFNGPGEAGSVISANFSSDKMAVTVDMQRKGLVVVTNAYNPLWTSSIDGKITHIFPVFHTFWGVIVPKGRHEIMFRFRDTTR